MQEALPPIFFRYASYPSKTSFSKSDKKIELRMRKRSFCFALCPVLSWYQ